jgi:tRNAThr (cytosine32-N3)-methyltransferase
MFPVLEENQNSLLTIHGRDYSPRAIEVLRSDPQFNEKYATAGVWDITSDTLPEGIAESSVDVITLCFVLSALVYCLWKINERNHVNGNKPFQIFILF